MENRLLSQVGEPFIATPQPHPPSCTVYRLMLETSSRHVSGFVNHNTGDIVVEASTKEFSISKHLYKTSDVSAAYNVGRVLAHRCNEMGLLRMIWEHRNDRRDKKVRF